MADEHDRASQLAAQEGAGELARMGIDPRALGLEPVSRFGPAAGSGDAGPGGRAGPPAESSGVFRGVAPVPVLAPTVAPPVGDPPPEGSTLSRPLTGCPAGHSQLELLEQVVEVPGWLLPAGWRRMLRAITLGMIGPGSAEAIQLERQLVARARTRRPEPQVIAFLAGKGGVGTTTTAAGVAVTFTALRNDSTALMCARSGAGSLGRRLFGQPAPSIGDPADARSTHLDQSSGWSGGQLTVLDGSPWHSPAVRGQVVQLLEDLRERHPLTLVDVGNELSETAHGALGRADRVVVVTAPDMDAVESARVAVSRVHQVDPFRLSTVVVALVCLRRRQYRAAVRQLTDELGAGAARIVPVPFDPTFASGGQLDLSRVRPATLAAYLRIAALVLEPGDSSAWFIQPAAAGSRR